MKQQEEPQDFYYGDSEMQTAYNNGFDAARDVDVILMKNCITLAAQLSWNFAMDNVFKGPKDVDTSKVEKYLREDDHFIGLPEEVINHFVQTLKDIH